LIDESLFDIALWRGEFLLMGREFFGICERTRCTWALCCWVGGWRTSECLDV